MLFADLGLSPDTLRALEDVGYEEPTPIQRMAIPHVMARRDVLGIAQTGTGKTASFTLPMIEILSSGRAKARMPRSLVLAPTRELASQVADNALLYSKYHKLSLALLIGGESLGDQQKILDKGVDILIATPGRLLDLFERGAILLRDVRLLVIDEADRMLDMGFIPDVERIVSLLPARRQTLFFSATMDKEIKRLADAFLTDPVEIRIEPTQKAAELVDQALVVVPSNDKREALRNLLRREEVTNAFIFCNRKRDVDILNRSLSKHGFDAVALHGDMPQYLRTERLERFKNGEVALLVCSDVAARGIDISDVSHVFNFDVPIHSEDYVHRIGRTGRAGRKGSAFTIASPADRKLVVAIEELLGNPIPRVSLEGFAAPDLDGNGPEDEAPAKGGRNGKSRSRSSRSQPGGRERSAPAASTTQTPEASQSAAREDRRGSESAGGQGRSQGRHQKRWRDNPQSEVMEMPIDDDAIGFGGFTPAFILEPVVAPEIDEAEELLLAAAEDEDIVLSEDTKTAAGSDSASGRKASSRKKEPRRRSRSRKDDASKDAGTDETLDGTDATVSPDENGPNGAQPDAASSELTAAENYDDSSTVIAAQDGAQPVSASEGTEDGTAVSAAPDSGTPESDVPVAADVNTETADNAEAAPPKKAATRRKAPAKKAPATPRTKKATAAKADEVPAEPAAEDAPAADTASGEELAEPVKKPAARTRRKAAPAEEGAEDTPPAKKPATRRASPRRKKTEEVEASDAPLQTADTDAPAAGTAVTDAAPSPSDDPDGGA